MNGLYNSLPCPTTPPSRAGARNNHEGQASHIPPLTSATIRRGQDLFQSSVLKHPDSAAQFYQNIAELRRRIRNVTDPSGAHKFIKILRDRGKLLRCYTQNFDGLEAREGLITELSGDATRAEDIITGEQENPKSDPTAGTQATGECEVVLLHGDLDTLRCQVCSARSTWTDQANEAFAKGSAPGCRACQQLSDKRRVRKKRALAIGALRPNIVLYGENHWEEDHLHSYIGSDLNSGPDLLLIMGTSLAVEGVKHMIKGFAKAVHDHENGRVVFVNRTQPAKGFWEGFIDHFVQMDCDDWVSDLQRREPFLVSQQGQTSIISLSDCDTDHQRAQDDNSEYMRTHLSTSLESQRRATVYKAKNAEERRVASWLEAYFPPTSVDR